MAIEKTCQTQRQILHMHSEIAVSMKALNTSP